MTVSKTHTMKRSPSGAATRSLASRTATTILLLISLLSSGFVNAGQDKGGCKDFYDLRPKADQRDQGSAKAFLNIAPTNIDIAALKFDHHRTNELPFYFRTVHGNFDFQLEVSIDTLEAEHSKPGKLMAGLMIRSPGKATDENHNLVDEKKLQLILKGQNKLKQRYLYSKNTLAGKTRVNKSKAKHGWYTLRAIRFDKAFILLSKHEYSGKWIVQERSFRGDMPAMLQVGLATWDTWHDAKDSGYIRDPQFPQDSAMLEQIGEHEHRFRNLQIKKLPKKLPGISLAMAASPELAIDILLATLSINGVF